MNILNELLHCEHQTGMGLGHQVECKLAYSFALTAGLLEQVILSDVSLF